MVGQEDENMLWQNEEDEEEEEEGENKSPNREEDVPDEDIVGVLVGPAQARNSVGGTSTIATIFLIVNAALGAGLLNFPKAFDQAGGVLVAVLVQASLLVFIMIALYILATTSDIKQSTTLQEAMHTAAGPWGRRLTSLIVTVYCFGTCITFLIIIGDQFDRAFASLVGPQFCHIWYLNRDFIMPATSVILILPLCYSKTIDFLQYVSMAGVLTIFYVVLLIVVEYAIGGHTPGAIKHKPEEWTDVFAVIPVICFGYQCHVSVIPIYSCMKHRTIKHFTIATTTAIAICVAVYTGAATFGYLTFGSKVDDDIISNYSATKPSVMVALIAMAAKTYTTYPILLFCGREGMDSLLKDLVLSEESALRWEKTRRVVIATTWFLLTMILAIEIPDISAVINMLGSLAAVFIFVFPGICLLQTAIKSDPGLVTQGSRIRIAGAFAFLLLGAFLFGVVLTQALIFNLSGSNKFSPLCSTKTKGLQSATKLFFKS